MKRAPSIGLVLLAVGLAVASVMADPMGSMRPEALVRLGQATASVGVHTTLSLLGGAAVLGAVNRSRVDWLPALVTGWLAWGLLGLPLAMAGLWGPLTAWLPGLVLGLGWLAASLGGRLPHGLRLPSPSVPMLGCAAVVGLVGLIDAAAPPIDTDELYQHLALPGRILRTGGLVGGVLHPDGSRPQLLSLLTSPLLAAGTDTAPRLWSTVCGVGILLGLEDLARRVVPKRATSTAVLAGAVLVGSYTFLHEVGLAANNLPTALAVLAAAAAGLAGGAVPLVACAGAALSFKYTAAGALAGIWLVLRLPWRMRLITGVLAIACVTPWWARNAIEGLHPLFPYTGWDHLPTGAPPGDLVFQYLDKYGAGRSPTDFLLLPWNAVMTADVGSFRFLGRLTPLVLLLVPGALWGMGRHPDVRRLGIISAVACGAWALGPHWLRHLLPVLPILALALAAGTRVAVGDRMPALVAATTIALAAGLPSNWGPVATHLADRLPAALGQEDRPTYLSRAVRSADAARWLNEHTPHNAVVAILYEWPGHLVDRTTVLGSVEDHVPTRYWLLVHGDQSIEALRARGVTHLVVGRFRFLRKWYPFLSDDVYEAMFEAPTQALEALLLKEATLVYEANHTRVYRVVPELP